LEFHNGACYPPQGSRVAGFPPTQKGGQSPLLARKETRHYGSSSGKYEIVYRDENERLRFQTVAGDLQDAVAEREKVMGRKRRGEPVGPSKQTFGDYAETWLAGLNKRPRTLDSYRYTLEKHLLPRFRARKLAELKTDDVARLVREMSEPSEDRPAGYSASTIDSALTCLSSLYRKAVRAGLVAANPVRGLEPDERPSHDDADRRILEEAEIARLLSAADEQRPLIALLVFSGLRIAEALGLVWEDVDFERGFIRVEKQLARNRERVPLKTRASRRKVVLVPQLAAILREHLMASRFKRPQELVFATPAGRGRDQRAASRSIQAAIARAGDGLSAHSLRHGFASMLIVGLRYDAVSVAGQLGHAKASTTMNVYAHEFEEARHADELREQFGAHYGHLASGS
jgi:integrase